MGVLKSTTSPAGRRSVSGQWAWAVVALMLLAGIASAQQTVYVKVKDAKVRADASATAAVVATLDVGVPLTVVATEGPRYKIRTAAGKEGYVSRLHVSDTKPSGGSLLSGVGSSGVQANEAQTVASIRGLSPAAKTMAADKGLSEQSVKWAEKMETESDKVTEAQVENFLKAENVGL